MKKSIVKFALIITAFALLHGCLNSPSGNAGKPATTGNDNNTTSSVTPEPTPTEFVQPVSEENLKDDNG